MSRIDRDPVPARPSDLLWREVLGDVLRRERADQGRRLADVAGDAGISVQYLSELERGLKDPSSEMLAAAAGALGLGLVDVLDRARQTLTVVRPIRLAQAMPAPRGAGSFGVTNLAA